MPWFRSGDAEKTNGDAETAAAKERASLEEALQWTSLVMNDDLDGAFEALQRGDSSFHSLGESVTFFMRSILGFEKQVMAEASSRLADCETRAWNDFKRAQQRPGSKLYPAGTEYELVRAEAQLMGAVVGVLHESLVEAMRSFLKLRKAFIILDGIIATETKMLAARAEDGNGGDGGGTSGSAVEAADAVEGEGAEAGKTSTTAAADADETKAPLAAPQSKVTDEELRVVDAVDIFIHSGANMCFGIILLILSLIPPAFSRILAVVGFRGDRARGVKMLWKSASHDNVNGALAGMVLLGYYNGLLGAVDIAPDAGDYDDDAEAVGAPLEKCNRLLAELRTRYPDSRLWRVEEARLLANNRKLAEAVQLLSTGPESRMKQVTALNDFELATDAAMIQDWVLMRDTFLLCLEVNDWSPAMYHYMAGCASLELYRDAVAAGDEEGARRRKAEAEASLRKGPQVAGKKRLMARQLPIETFVQRKVVKWEGQAKAWGVDLADAIGASPALEMCYMWNGPKRMGDDDLARGVKNLAWTRCTAPADVLDERISRDGVEVAVWAVSMSGMLRAQGKLDEARRVIEEHVMIHDRAIFKGANKDDYVLPTATYELGVIEWVACCHPPADLAAEDVAAYRRGKLDECEAQLNKAKAWESYTLDARIGMRIQSGLETVAWLRRKMSW
ncbi:hypothetical protein RJ55_06919 [Drechmeria coniospora]|nr:hypothetical protein RJ55_06919 [Drechmeria coniospora]